MKKIVMASAVMAATAMAGDLDSRPAASVPTPVEAREALHNVPNMSEKEKGDWQKLREERRAAREQILQDLRNKTAAEKGEMRDASAKAPVVGLPAVEKHVPEAPIERNEDKLKKDLVREKKLEEKQAQKGPLWNPPFGPPMGRPGDKKIMEPLHPGDPRSREKNPKDKPVVKPIMPVFPKGWNKG